MLRLFRQIRKKIVEDLPASPQGKYIFYAIGEILLVVIGILIALQVNNWNENRKIRASEVEILNNLKVELVSNQERLNEMLKLHTEEYEEGLYLLTLFGTDISGIPISKLDSSLFKNETAHSFEANDGYIKSLIASNKIDHIQNAELKSYISSFDMMVYDAVQELEYLARLLHERLWPAIDGKINTLDRLRTYESFEHYPKGTYPSDYEWFFASREVEDIVSNIVSWKQTIVNEEQILKDNIEKMIRLIEGELER